MVQDKKKIGRCRCRCAHVCLSKKKGQASSSNQKMEAAPEVDEVGHKYLQL